MQVEFNGTLELADIKATGTIEVIDWTELVGVAATGTIQFTDWEALIGSVSTGTFTVTAFASLADKTFTVGEETITEGVDFDAETSEAVTATNLAAALDTALNGVANVAADGAVVTITTVAKGFDQNLGMSTSATAGVTLSGAHLEGGIDSGTIVIGEDTLIEGTDFDAEDDLETTLDNVAAAIEALSDYTSSAADGVITVTFDGVGVAGNVAISASPAYLFTLSGDTLEGGKDNGAITIGELELVHGVDFTAVTDNDTTAAAIEAVLIISDITTAVDDNIITLTADNIGTAYNLAVSTSAPLAFSFADMAGGNDAYYSEVLDYSQTDNNAIAVRFELDSLEGDDVVVTVQASQDKETWRDYYAVGTLTEAGEVIKTLGKKQLFARLKVVFDDEFVMNYQMSAVHSAATDDETSGGESGGSGGGVQVVELTLSGDQIRALNDASFLFLAAPGANKIIVPISVMACFNYVGGVPFNNSGGVELGYSESINSVFASDGGLSLDGGQSTISMMIPTFSIGGSGYINAAQAGRVNEGIYIYNQSPNYTGGGESTITFTMAYFIANTV